MTEVQQHTMTRESAERLTERIRMVATTFMETRDKLSLLIRQAQEGQAHLALGYRSWTEYVAAVCSDTPLMRLSRDERRVIVSDLAEQGMSTRAIAPVVGATHTTVQADIRGGRNLPPASPATPAEPTFDETPAWDPVGVNTETGEVLPGSGENSPHPRSITGMDGKTYTRPEPKEEPYKPPRRPLTDQFRDATVDLRKITDRLEKLVADDRFPRNREQVALIHQSDLSRASNALAKVIDALSD